MRPAARHLLADQAGLVDARRHRLLAEHVDPSIEHGHHGVNVRRVRRRDEDRVGPRLFEEVVEGRVRAAAETLGQVGRALPRLVGDGRRRRSCNLRNCVVLCFRCHRDLSTGQRDYVTCRFRRAFVKLTCGRVMDIYASYLDCLHDASQAWRVASPSFVSQPADIGAGMSSSDERVSRRGKALVPRVPFS
jgi:hypothetical protein